MAHILGGRKRGVLALITVECYLDPDNLPDDVPHPLIVRGYRDTSRLSELPLEGPAQIVARTHVADQLAGAQHRKLGEVLKRHQEMLEFVMDRVIDPATGKSIPGPDGEPLVPDGLVEAYLTVLKPKPEDATEEPAPAGG